ncbi:MAG: hypothetical protein COB50_01065 [Thiotrichales bacterium]|nr:MAG: hypothetical protein COB50_01065 [Thiotrichales bacterium]
MALSEHSSYIKDITNIIKTAFSTCVYTNEFDTNKRKAKRVLNRVFILASERGYKQLVEFKNHFLFGTPDFSSRTSRKLLCGLLSYVNGSEFYCLANIRVGYTRELVAV